MIFKTELELQEKIAALDFEFYETYPVSFVRREVRVGGCIPDLVSINFLKDPNTYTWPVRWSYRHSFVMWLLRDQALGLEDIASLFFEPASRIKPLVRNLVSSNIVIELDDGKLSLAKHIQDEFQANVIAVEAKLRDWRQALLQAIRYKDFANLVFVAMDATTIPTLDTSLQQFKDEQVGLCAVSLHTIEWVVYPTNRNEKLGHEKEYLMMSTIIPTTQRLWSRRNNWNASSQE